MAYASLVSLEHVLEQILDHHDRDPSILDDDKQQIKSLHDNIVFLVAFLDDFPDGTGALLEGRMSNAANRAEDIIECQISDEMRWGVMYRAQQVILSIFSGRQIRGGTGHRIWNWKRLQKELRNVTIEVEAIVGEVMQIKSSCGAKDPIVSRFPSSSSSGLVLSGKGIVAVGLKKDLREIKGRLYGESSRLGIIPIVGMGGIGKTTLARYAYDDLSMEYHFDVRAWVTVSQHYNIEKIYSSILLSMNPSTKELYDMMREEELLEHLYKFLKGRRYLIVVDDIWDVHVWDALRRIFPDDYNKSRIIITTRHLVLASYVDPSSHPHEMDFMDKVQSWNLLRQKVFRQEQCPRELEQIGKFIAEKCGGLPLAIVVIAGILSKASLTLETWERIASDVNEAMNARDDRCTKILSLSYKHLPHRLKPCFLYMGGFPEDYEISVSKLIKLWVAEGFLKMNRSKIMEEVAKECLEDLINRSLVWVVKAKRNGNIKAIKIHDLLRDLCLKIAEDEGFLKDVKRNSLDFLEDIRKSRRVSTSLLVLDKFHGDYVASIRTILLTSPAMGFKSWKTFKMLRILDAYGVPLTSFPIEICQLFHLRYLVFTIRIHMRKFEVPKCLSQLQNLQTLIIMSIGGENWRKNLMYLLPCEIWRLPRLRHLILRDVYLSDPCAGDLAALKDLRTLSRVITFICSERIVECVPNLNKLEISYGFNDTCVGWPKYKLNNLVHFQLLEKLNLHVYDRGPDDFSLPYWNFCFPVLQKSDIAFPKSLKKLTLRGCRFPWQDMTVIGLLPNLEVLKLKKNACYGDKWETTEGEFYRLKVLLIENTDPQKWVTESSNFPCLQSLHLFYCGKLDEIPLSIGEIPTLQLIELDCCKPSIEESAKCIEEEQRSFGNDDLKVRMLSRGAFFWNSGI